MKYIGTMCGGCKTCGKINQSGNLLTYKPFVIKSGYSQKMITTPVNSVGYNFGKIGYIK